MSYVCCLFSPLPRKVFLRVLRSGYSGPDTPVLPCPQKPPFRNSNSSRNHQLEEEPLSGCTTSKSLFKILTVINYFIYLYSVRGSSPFFPALYYLNTWKMANLTMGLIGLNPSREGTGACGWKNVSPICASLLFLIPQAIKPTWPAKLLSKNCILPM